MRKIGYNFLLILGLMITFGVANKVSANGNDTKRPKNTGILAVKTSPGSYPVVVDGVQVQNRRADHVKDPAEELERSDGLFELETCACESRG